MQLPGHSVGVAHLELLVGELAVHQEDVLGKGDLLGHLDSVDGFAQVGVGEQAADLAFVPKFVVEGIWIWAFARAGRKMRYSLRTIWGHPTFFAISMIISANI